MVDGYSPEGPVVTDDQARNDLNVPWTQRLYESIWVWAAVAILFWVLSYLVWGFIDLISIPAG
jgi:hypothetical protein